MSLVTLVTLVLVIVPVVPDVFVEECDLVRSTRARDQDADEPMVPAGEKASFNCTYDLTGPLGRKITHGFAGSHEMCIAYLAVAVPESRSNGAIYFNDRSLASHGNYGPGGCWIQGGE